MVHAYLAVAAVTAFLILVNALYVAGEFSAVKVRRTTVVTLARRGERAASALLSIRDDRRRLDDYVAACQVGITVSSLALGLFGERYIAPLLERSLSSVSWPPLIGAAKMAAAAGGTTVIVLFALTTLQVVFGELAPKSLAIRFPERVAMIVTLPVKWSAEALFRPLVAVLNRSAWGVLRLARLRVPKEPADAHSPAEILVLVQQGHEGGLIDADQRRWLRNALLSSQTKVAAIAVPRTRLIAAEVTWPLEKILRVAAGSEHSRIPLYEGDIDHLVGLVYLRDLVALSQEAPGASVRKILRPLTFVPATLSLDAVWDRLTGEGTGMAVVLDEYGGTQGIVTRTDVIEAVFGELPDELEHEAPAVTPAGPGRFLVRGDTLVSRINETLGLALPTTSLTIAGLLLERLGHVPNPGEGTELAGVLLRVEASSPTAIRTVSVNIGPQPSSSGQADESCELG